MWSVIKRVLFIGVVSLLAIAIVGTVILRVGGFQMRAVLTGSMEPELPVGAMLVIKKTPLDQLKIGDDITFVRDKNLTVVTHRIVAIDKAEETVTTQGIANNTIDAPVYYENILGKVVWSVPVVGYLILWMNTTQGKIIAITAVIAIVCIWMISGLLFGGKKKKKTDFELTEAEASDVNKEKILSDAFDSLIESDNYRSSDNDENHSSVEINK